MAWSTGTGAAEHIEEGGGRRSARAARWRDTLQATVGRRSFGGQAALVARQAVSQLTLTPGTVGKRLQPSPRAIVGDRRAGRPVEGDEGVADRPRVPSPFVQQRAEAVQRSPVDAARAGSLALGVVATAEHRAAIVVRSVSL